jgi:tRNA A-37 threonylcarbamoyl transferase component Bud32
VGSGDRVARREITVAGFKTMSVEVNLDGSENLVFKGCPPAVMPYLQGELGTAARALARDGQAQLSHLLEAQLHEGTGRNDRAAALYEQAGDSESAIRLLLQVSDDHPDYASVCQRLADAYEREGHFELAAHKLQQAISAAGSGAQLAELYFRWADLLEKCDDLIGALDALQKASLEDPEYPNITTRIEILHKKISCEERSATEDGNTAPIAMNPSESRYDLIEQIGAGGMGVVFRARDRRLGREVALKRLPENLREHPTAVQLFLREARAAAALNHPNIVTLFDADEENGAFFITMELLKGKTLSAILRERTRLNVCNAATVTLQITEGLNYAHERRIVHRDIKPANLFFTYDRVMKIMDFGLAKMIEEVRRAATVLSGTPYYMAPEQSSGEASGPSAHIYALGITLYELLTARVPFRDGDVAQAHREATPPDPRSLVGNLPDALAELVLQMLQKRPDDRPTAAELLERLEPFTRS